MRIPQTPERIKEAPAQALRAVFAGVGQVLLITERVRRRATSSDDSPSHLDDSRTAATSTATSTDAPLATSTVPLQTAAPLVPEQAASPEPQQKSPAAPIAETPAPVPPAAAAPVTDELPLANYSGLSVASLRARMRGLDTGQLQDLIAYEQAHENRENVTSMFERRIAKLESGADEGTAAG